MCIVHEPEAWPFFLPPKGTATIEIDAVNAAVLLAYTFEKGIAYVRILPDASLYCVTSDGVDVFAKCKV